MKQKLIGIMAAVLAVAGLAVADTFTYSASVSNTQVALSDEIAASGWLDKIEISNASGNTSEVRVCTWDVNTNQVDAFCIYNGAGQKVVRVRYVPTSTNGTALSGEVTTTASVITNVSATTIVGVPYERPMVGGNLRIKITGGGSTSAQRLVTVVGYYEPLKK